MISRVLIMGRTRSGKNWMAREIASRTGMQILKIRTTCPPRFLSEDSVTCCSQEELTAVPEDRRLFASPCPGGGMRWTTREEFESAGIAILNPACASEAVSIWEAGNHQIMALYIHADEELRARMAVRELIQQREVGLSGALGRAVDDVLEEFRARSRTEAPEFDHLEHSLQYIMGDPDPAAADRDGLILERSFWKHRNVLVTVRNTFIRSAMSRLCDSLCREYDIGGCRSREET